MRKITYLILLTSLIIISCNPGFKKGDEGIEYKIFSEGNGPTIKQGQFMQMHIGQYYDNGKTDSLLQDTRKGSPVIEPMDTAYIPKSYFKIISQLKKGDSLVMRILIDSMFSKNPESIPPYFKKGHYFITTVKLINILKNKAEADSANKAELLIVQKKDSINYIAAMASDDKKIRDYLTNNKLSATKATLGTYVQIIQPGTGPLIDTSVVVVTNYTGRTLDGKMFDSNTDPSKGHVEPFKVNMTSDWSLGTSVIPGWTDGLKLLNKGAKAKFYIPSPLAYGSKQMGPDIKPNSILVFDIEVLDVLSRERAVAEANEKEKLRMEKQKKLLIQDSLAKAAQKKP
jgi:FKBP-type peptidyl-prolyl cis-trans isomerase FkpA